MSEEFDFDSIMNKAIKISKSPKRIELSLPIYWKASPSHIIVFTTN